MSPVLHKLARSEKGFTLAEVVIALVIFVACVIGISLMVLSGSASVYRGAMETQASTLAQKKVEELKTLQYYTPWTGANKDIDDFYWAFDGNTPRSNADQFANSHVEDYGTITGNLNFKRTTAVKYIETKLVDGKPVLDPNSNPTMNLNWVPKSMTANSVTSPQFDRPQDNGTPTSTKLRALMVEVTIYYHVQNSSAELHYVTHSIISDLMVTGASNNPILVVKSINPISGNWSTDTNLQMDITVQSDGLQDDFNAGTAKVYATLWYEGQDDINCKEYEAGGGNATILNNGTDIQCHFNLADHNYTDPITGATKHVNVRAGVYNLEVYWTNRGWKDTSYRGCFTVIAPASNITGVTNFTWGHKGQTGRQVTINGNNFNSPVVSLKWNGTVIPGSIASSTLTQIVANFDLSTITDQDTHVDIQVITAGGIYVSQSDSQRLYVNPKPVISSISANNPGNYYNWGHSGMSSRYVQITGTYLYDMGDSANSSSKLTYSGSQTNNATYVSGGTADTSTDGSCSSLIMSYPISTAFNSGNRYSVPNSNWGATLTNFGGNATTSGGFTMNPPPVITGIAPTSSPTYFNWVHSAQTNRKIGVQGKYLYGLSASDGTNEVWIDGGGKQTTNTTWTYVSGWDDTADPTTTQTVTFTVNPLTANVGYSLANTTTYFSFHVKNYGSTCDSTADATTGVMFNPTPQISTIAGTSGDHYNWGHSGETDRNIMITGSYLYGFNDTSAIAKLWYGGTFATPTYVTSRNSGGSGTYIVSPPPSILNNEIGTEPVEFNFSPSTASGAAFSTPNTLWNVHLYNFGGVIDSSTDAMRVTMNPTTTITGVTATSSPTNYNWAYLAQTSRPVQINGTNFYGMNVSGGSAQLKFGGYTTTTVSATVGTMPTDACALNTASSVIVTFNPLSSGASGTTRSNWSSAWYPIITCYGGSGINTPAATVLMNPPPTMTAKTSFPAPGKTGTASEQANKTYTNLSLTGTYAQTGVTTVYLVSTATPTATSTYMDLCQGSAASPATTAAIVSDDGTDVSGLNMRMAVSPVTGYKSFMVWGSAWTTPVFTPPTTADAVDANIQGTVGGSNPYYAVYANPDGQFCTTAITEDVTHSSYTITFSAYQVTASNTLFGRPDNASLACYQDGLVTNSATACNTLAGFREWREGSASIEGVEKNQTFTATSNRTIQCRYYQYLYSGATAPAAITWVNGYSVNSGTYNFDSGGWLQTQGIWSGGWFGVSDRGERSASTNAIDLTNCTRAEIHWKNTDGANAGEAYFVLGYASGGNYETDWNQRIEKMGSTGWEETRTLNIDVGNRTSGKYIRVHGRAGYDGSWDYAKIFTSYIYVE